MNSGGLAKSMTRGRRQPSEGGQDASCTTNGVLTGSTVNVGFNNNFTVGTAISTDWLFTARARLGWTESNWLVYATGGLAMSRVTIRNSYSDDFLSNGFQLALEGADRSSLKTGWTVGAGLEVALTQNWSLKAEYLYVNLGSVDLLGQFHFHDPNSAGAGYTQGLGVSADLTAQVARFGVNFKF